MRAATLGIAAKVGATVSVHGQVGREVETGSRFASDAQPREDVCSLAANRGSLVLKEHVAALVGGSGRRREGEAHNSAVEQPAGSHALAAAAHRERSPHSDRF